MKRFLRSDPQPPGARFVYDITRKSRGQQAAGAEYARLACLCGFFELEELCAPYDIGSFCSYIHIEVQRPTTQMTEECHHTRTTPPHVSCTTQDITTLALIKRTTFLDPLVPLSTQLHPLNLFGGDETPSESLHAVVSCGVEPCFDAFVGKRAGTWKDAGGGGGSEEAKLGIPMTKKKFAELNSHSKLNAEIPETNFVVHPVIQRAVEVAKSGGQRPNFSHIPSKFLTDSWFLNYIHSHVNSWIKAIRAVIKLTRDRHGISRDHLLVEPQEGVGGDRGAVEERGGGDGYGCIEEHKELPYHY
ncbi:hypothetical protein K443DRAFT_258466 [Laccaria amethystina LaAM-08-1]|uniref:Unplaced genomic scaffold K443scaffold_165, whole genome shotgun sequence n=1 Tax=Laccaria amethystina LaAM-08-1 TaxID=1095629 RepID=A0A0C9X753_9AGAR|nr:hypothetical protein K443DRAFT_258466 [Laccaria amethystina LaAM-08-1]